MKDSSIFHRIYQEFQADREKVRGRSIRYQLEYFFMYYKIPVLLTAAAAAVLLSVLYSRSQYKEYAFQACFVNADSTRNDAALEQGFEELTGIDQEKYAVSIDSSILIDGTSPASIASTEKLSANINSQLLDVCVMPKELFLIYAEQGCYGDPRDFLTKEQFAEYEEQMIYLDGIPVGIEAKDFQGIAGTGLYSAGDDPIFGIIYNTKHKEECGLFLEFLSAYIMI